MEKCIDKNHIFYSQRIYLYDNERRIGEFIIINNVYRFTK